MSMKRIILPAACCLACLAFVGYAAWRYTKTPEYRVRFGSPAQKQWAIRLLVEEGADSRDWQRITQCLDSPHLTVALTAVSALGNARRGEATDTLVTVIEGPRAEQLGPRALEALAQIGTEGAWNEVKSALRRQTPRLRRSAMSLLIRHGRKGAIPELRSSLENASPELRKMAAAGLRDLTTPRTRAGDVPEVGSTIIFEAEQGHRFRGNFEVAPSDRLRPNLSSIAEKKPLYRGTNAASGRWIRCLEGAGGNHEWLGGESGSIDIGRVQYPLVVPESGRYDIWARAWWMDKCGNSFNVWLDHGRAEVFRNADKLKGPYRQWTWISRAEPVRLTAGIHTLHVQAREDGIRLDQFMLLPPGQNPPSGPAEANYEPLALAPQNAELTLSRNSRIISENGKLHITAWVLRGGQNELEATLELDAPGADVAGSEEVKVRIPKDRRLWSRDFTVSYPPQAERREYTVSAALATDGENPGSQQKSLIVRKPWDWLVAGPFPEPRTADNVLNDRDIEWQSLSPDEVFDRYGRMDLESVFGNGTTGYAYMKTRIRSEETKPLLWLLNSDDSSKVWMGGEVVIKNPRNAPSSAFLARTRRTISPGTHTIVAECFQKAFPDGHIYYATQNYWLFRLRVRRDEHVPARLIGLPWNDQGESKTGQ